MLADVHHDHIDVKQHAENIPIAERNQTEKTAEQTAASAGVQIAVDGIFGVLVAASLAPNRFSSPNSLSTNAQLYLQQRNLLERYMLMHGIDKDGGASKRPLPSSFNWSPKDPSEQIVAHYSKKARTSSDYSPQSFPARSKQCSHASCQKAARGSSGLCIMHGGGTKCKHEGCTTLAKEGGLCKAHGGGIRCGKVGCTKSSQEGGLCIAHGGGRRCAAEACTKLAKEGGFCIGHGGGKRCKEQWCTKSAQARGLCKAHGGGRCSMSNCTKFAQSGGVCILHGGGKGGKRCSERRCRRMVKGDGSSLCQSHGGVDETQCRKLFHILADGANQVVAADEGIS